MFDSVAFSRKSGVRAPRRPVPVAFSETYNDLTRISHQKGLHGASDSQYM